MRMRTLGGLALEGSSLARRIPLLLLTHLAVEGEAERGHLSALFWPAAKDPRGALRVAVSRLRRAAPGCVETAGGRLRAAVGTDVEELRRDLRQGRVDAAARTYAGPFLDGVHLDSERGELEEWLFEKRERIAEELRLALLTAAERDRAAGAEARATVRAELAYTLPGAAPPEPDALARLHRILHGGDSALARLAHVEAGRFGIALAPPTAPRRAPVPRVRPAYAPPLHATSFVGRADALGALLARLRDPRERLVTVVGLPGVGKSRLALEAARALALDGDTSLTVSAVSAEHFVDPRRIAEGLAHALGLEPDAATDALTACTEALGRNGPHLLLLDGVDHLLEGAAVLTHLLAVCPTLTLLATSRQRLHLDLERVFPVSTLPFEGPLPPAVELFAERVRRAAPRPHLDADDLRHARRICRAVGGLPLAIELAAAWARALPLTDIADEVERTLGFLDAPTRDVAPRERSLRAAVAYSWRLLEPRDRAVLRRLGAFRGGFRRAAAGAVAGADARALAALVDASLVELAPDGRYAMHPAVADLARHELDGCARAAAATRRRHRRYFLGELPSWRRALAGGGRQGETLARIARELPNLRQAWEQALRRGRGADLYALARTLSMYFELAHRFREGADVLTWSEAQLDPADPAHAAARGSLHACWAWHHLRRGDTGTARTRARAAIALLDAEAVAGGDAEGVVDAHHALAAALLAERDTAAARRHAERALLRAREAGLTREGARLLVLHASIDAATGRIDGARARLAEANALFRQLDDRRDRSRTLLAASEVARRADDPVAAAKDLETALRLARDEGMEDEARRARSLLATLPADLGRQPSAFPDPGATGVAESPS